jgi:hypothetical protein
VVEEVAGWFDPRARVRTATTSFKAAGRGVPSPVSGKPRAKSVVRAILVHLSLWDEPRPPPAPSAAARVPLELEYLPSVE